MASHPDPVPSSFDMPPIMGGSPLETVKEVLVNARDRYETHGTFGTYVSRYGEACAAGSVLMASKEFRAWARTELMNHEDPRDWWDGGDPTYALVVEMSAFQAFEATTAVVVKEAMHLLNLAAEELYGEEARLVNEDSEDDDSGDPWGYDFGLVEAINESSHFGGLFSERMQKVLRCYDRAIEMAEGGVR